MTPTTTTDAELMSATMAGRIRMEFTAMMRSDIRRSYDPADEPRDVAPMAAAAEAAPTMAIAVAPMAGQTPAVRRQRARRTTFRPSMLAQPLTADDLL